MTRWEYMVVFLNNPGRRAQMKLLDWVGESGWELVSVSNAHAYFKRPVLAQDVLRLSEYEPEVVRQGEREQERPDDERLPDHSA